MSFDDGMSIVKQNLDALYEIPKPSFGTTIKSALRILVALYTFGIVLFFWKRPKKRFNKEIYEKLKNIIRRNINFLKLSSKGSIDLMERIKIFENELDSVDKEIKKGIFAKTLAIAVVVGIYLIWFIFILNQEPKSHSTYNVTPFDTIVKGNLSENVSISADTFIIRHSKAGSGSDWNIDIILKTKKIENPRREIIKYKAILILTDIQGVPIAGFEPALLSYSAYDLFNLQISSQDSAINHYEFNLKNKFDHMEYEDTIPVNAVKFIIEADSSHSKY
jgi:hypothetical protein